MSTLQDWHNQLEQLVQQQQEHDDGSHDLGHLRRVWNNAQEIMRRNSASQDAVDELVVLTACYLHDIVCLEKNDPRRAQASSMAADTAIELLKQTAFPTASYDAVHHAIRAHSFSAAIPVSTPEAAIVQDADRIEALGAIGIARCFYTGGRLGGQLFDADDPMATARELDDKRYALDHFTVKLLKLPETMQTDGGRSLANERADRLRQFRQHLLEELAYTQA